MNKNEMGGAVACMGTGEVHTGFWWREMTVRNRFEDLGLMGG
jgi:hypothetical protein